MARVTIHVEENLKDLIDQEAKKERISISRFLSRIIEDFLLEESDDAILQRVNQLELKFDRVNDRLILIETQLEGFLLQLGKLKPST